MYALAAGAAVAGLALPADAKIVYTAANQPIGSELDLDVNHDGVIDFYLYKTWTGHGSTFGWWSGYLLFVFAKPNQFWRTQTQYRASALPTRVLIGSNAGRFVSNHGLMAVQKSWCTSMFSTKKCGSTAYGPWANVTDRYLGLKFQIKGKTHYGWARLTVDWLKLSATLTGYAYETVADKPILIGNGPLRAGEAAAATNTMSAPPITEPRGLGSLALGTAVRKYAFGEPLTSE
jgi:hypothetical protein